MFILVKPTISINFSCLHTMNEVNNISCECTGEGGKPQARINWYKDDLKIGGTERENPSWCTLQQILTTLPLFFLRVAPLMHHSNL